MPAINRVLLSGEVYSPTRAGCSPSPTLTIFQALDYTGHMPHLDPQLLPIAHRLSDWTCFTIGGVVLKTRPACPATTNDPTWIFTTTQHQLQIRVPTAKHGHSESQRRRRAANKQGPF